MTLPLSILTRLFQDQVEDVPMLRSAERPAFLDGFPEEFHLVAAGHPRHIGPIAESDISQSGPRISISEELARKMPSGSQRPPDARPNRRKAIGRAEGKRKARIDQVGRGAVRALPSGRSGSSGTVAVGAVHAGRGSSRPLLGGRSPERANLDAGARGHRYRLRSRAPPLRDDGDRLPSTRYERGFEGEDHAAAAGRSIDNSPSNAGRSRRTAPLRL